MWEMILLLTAAFLGGWGIRGIIDRRTVTKPQMGKPEMMWFNEKKSRWDRVTEMQLLVDDRVVVTVPVKLVEDKG